MTKKNFSRKKKQTKLSLSKGKAHTHSEKLQQFLIKAKKLGKLQDEIHFMLDEIAKIKGLN